MRQCGQCGSDISHRDSRARFCEDPECHRVRMLAHGRASYHRNREDIRERQNAAHRARMAARPKQQRFCAYCGTDISHRRFGKWCDLRCRDKARHSDRAVHRWNRYAARVQRDSGLLVDPPIPPSEWAHVLSGTACAYCAAVGTMEPDHVVPLSRGGRHVPANIVPCCMSCNRSKRDSTLAEWQARSARLCQE